MRVRTHGVCVCVCVCVCACVYACNSTLPLCFSAADGAVLVLSQLTGSGETPRRQHWGRGQYDVITWVADVSRNSAKFRSGYAVLQCHVEVNAHARYTI